MAWTVGNWTRPLLTLLDAFEQKGKCPQGFLIKWRNANRSLNPYASAGAHHTKK